MLSRFEKHCNAWIDDQKNSLKNKFEKLFKKLKIYVDSCEWQEKALRMKLTGWKELQSKVYIEMNVTWERGT